MFTVWWLLTVLPLLQFCNSAAHFGGLTLSGLAFGNLLPSERLSNLAFGGLLPRERLGGLPHTSFSGCFFAGLCRAPLFRLVVKKLY